MRKNKATRLLALLLSILMLVSVASCGDNGNEVQKDVPKEEQGDSQNSDEESLAKEDSVGGQAKEDFVTIRWIMGGSKPDEEELAAVLEAANTITEEKIGVTLEIEFMDFGEMTEKMKMYMASGGKDFDICFTSSWANDYRAAASQGGFLELSELIADTTPNLAASMPQYYLDATKVEGGIYCIPNRQSLVGTLAVYVRKDLADKYHLDVEALSKKEWIEPEDLEEFCEQVLQGEEGVIPYTGEYAALFSELWRGEKTYSDIYTSSEQQVNILYSDSNTVVPYMKPGTEYFEKQVEAYKEYKEWMQKGYIQSDVASVLGDEIGAGFKAGKYAIAGGTNVRTDHGAVTVEQDVEVYCLNYAYTIFDLPSVTATATAISSGCEHPEKALQVIELANTDSEFFNLLALGIEGRHYTLDEQGRYDLIEDSGYMNSGWAIGNTFIGYASVYQEPDANVKFGIMNDEAEKDPYSLFTFDKSAVSTELIALDDIAKEHEKDWLIKDDIEQALTDIYELKLDAGLDKVVAEVQRQWDAFLEEQ